MTLEEKLKAQLALSFLTKKQDGTVKGRTIYNGKLIREWLGREESASPTASLQSIMIMAVVDVVKERYVMTINIPNAFIQTPMPDIEEKEHVTMKITGVLVDILINLAPRIYQGYVVFKNGKKTVYVQVLRAIYGVLQSELLWYNKLKEDLVQYGFIFNPYDPCVANKEIE